MHFFSGFLPEKLNADRLFLPARPKLELEASGNTL